MCVCVFSLNIYIHTSLWNKPVLYIYKHQFMKTAWPLLSQALPVFPLLLINSSQAPSQWKTQGWRGICYPNEKPKYYEKFISCHSKTCTYSHCRYCRWFFLVLLFVFFFQLWAAPPWPAWLAVAQSLHQDLFRPQATGETMHSVLPLVLLMLIRIGSMCVVQWDFFLLLLFWHKKLRKKIDTQLQ